MGWSFVTMSVGWIGGIVGLVWLPRPPLEGGLAGVLTDAGGITGVLVADGGTAGLADGGGIVGVLVDGGGMVGLLVGGGDIAGVLTDGTGTDGAARALGGSAGDGADTVERVCVREDSAAGSSSAASKSDGSLRERCRSHRSRHECQLRCGC